VRGLADGALHIRPRMEEVFNAGPFRFILDRPHCKEHQSQAGKQLEAEGALGDSVTVQQWANEALARLEVGDAADVIAELTRAWNEDALGEHVHTPSQNHGAPPPDRPLRRPPTPSCPRPTANAFGEVRPPRVLGSHRSGACRM